jgi:hypothetical protein
MISDPNYALGQAVDGAPGNYPLFCETDVQLPETAELGKPYTVYWVWQWNTVAGSVDPSYPNGKDEYYSTCIDVDVSPKDVALTADAEVQFDLGPQQDAMTIAVSDFSSRTAIMTDVRQGEVGPIFSGAPTGTPSGAPPTTTPSATGGTPAASSIVPSLSGGGPFLNSTAPAPTGIPILNERPGVIPTSLAGVSDIVTITDTILVTVTAPAASHPPASAVTPRAAHGVRHINGAKFRGMFTK